jgi:large subunit ribosomal protein L29
MKAAELRDLTLQDLQARLEQARESYFRLRFQSATGQLPDHSKMRLARRDIARLATVLRERELAGPDADERGEA